MFEGSTCFSIQCSRFFFGEYVIKLKTSSNCLSSTSVIVDERDLDGFSSYILLVRFFKLTSVSPEITIF